MTRPAAGDAPQRAIAGASEWADEPPGLAGGIVELHASCVAVRRFGPDASDIGRAPGVGRASAERAPWAALLIDGPAGAGKSSLALGLLARGARLVADDRVALRADGAGGVLASATERHRAAGIADVVEARGLGLLRAPAIAAAPLWLVCRLLPLSETPPRLPRKGSVNLCGAKVPSIETGGGCALADGLYLLLQRGELLDPDTPLLRGAEGQR